MGPLTLAGMASACSGSHVRLMILGAPRPGTIRSCRSGVAPYRSAQSLAGLYRQRSEVTAEKGAGKGVEG